MTEAAPDVAERALLGAVLLSAGDVLDDLHLEPSDFREPALGALYSLTRHMRSTGRPVDVVTVAEAIRGARDPVLNRINAAALHELIQMTPSVASATAYEAIVERAAVVRRIAAATRKMRAATEGDASPDDLIEAARQAVDEVAGQIRMQVRPVREDLQGAIDELREPPQQNPTPWIELDELIGGFRPGRLYTFGARPGVGKTAVALQCALTMSRTGAVSISSLEMGRNEIIYRALSMATKISVRRLTSGQLSESEWARVQEARLALATRPLHIDDRSDVTVTQVLQYARAVQRRHPLAGVILDYLQLMRSERGDRRPRHEVVADYSRQLKIMARTLEIPVIALSQLNRASTMRQDGRPALSDLRESGAVEQDSDVVVLLHRDLDDPDKSRTLHMHVAKNRQGPTGHFNLNFAGDFTQATSRRFQ